MRKSVLAVARGAKASAVSSAVAAKDAADAIVDLGTDRRMQVTIASAVGGAAVVGTGGAAAGAITGGAVGAALGVVPALFTFGLSIPVMAMVCGTCGLAVGGTVGSATGMSGGAAVSYYRCCTDAKREQIRERVLSVPRQIHARVNAVTRSAYAIATSRLQAGKKMAEDLRSQAMTQANIVVKEIKSRVGKAKAETGRAAVAAKTTTTKVLSDKTVQTTAAGVAGGAVALGTGGAATGLVAGGVAGAAAGVLPALFTFGLSIPFFAVVGAGCGAAAGTAMGSSTGAVLGGAGGYSYTKRETIRSSLQEACSKAGVAAASVKETAFSTPKKVRARLVAATGGTSE